MDAASPPPHRQAVKVSPKDKPLPSPPVVQVGPVGSSTGSKSLIDAGDRPLRRSLTGLTEHEGDWPVLQPRQSTSLGSLRGMMRETGAQLTQQAVPSQKERYPVLGNTLRQGLNQQLPISRYSATYKDLDENLSPLPLTAKSDERTASVRRRPSVDDDPFRDGVYNTDLTASTKRNAASPSKLAVNTTNISKSGQDSKPTIEPRQNRTSSLRARLSASQVVNNSLSKTAGSTEFTAPKEQTDAADRRDSLRAQKEAQARRSVTPPIAPSLREKTPNDSIGTGRAPAQFVAGSRRSAHPRRPSSRGSLRNESRVPSPVTPLSSMPPSRAALMSLKSRDENKGPAKNVPQPHPGLSTKQQTSTIAPARKALSNITNHDNEKVTHPETESPKIQSASYQRQARDEFGIYNEHSSQDLVNDLEATPPHTATNQPAPFLNDNKDTYALEAIEESPQHAYQLKRLSMHSPEYGPTLKISTAAERFIMGPSPDKDTRSLRKKSSKDLNRADSRDDQKSKKGNKTPPSSVSEQSVRPSSSQGLSRLRSRVGLIDRKAREKKVKSADLSLASPEIPERSTERPIQPHVIDVNASAAASKASTNTSTDPFFDAPEELPTSSSKDAVSVQTSLHEQDMSPKDSWISPLMAKGGEQHVSNHTSSVALQKGFGDDLDVEATPSQEPNAMQEYNTASLDFAKRATDKTKNSPIIVLPSTPQNPIQGPSAHSGSHPPRSSSRQAPPDWTTNKKSPSPPAAEDVPPPTPPKDFSRRQNNLGSLRGHGSSQIDLKNAQHTHGSWRDSTPRDSYKSQASLSKGNSVLSNLKGLFHKRSSETEPIKTGKGKTKSKVSVTSNGSPFPPMSEIHPIHRPTLASTNRSKPTNTSTTTPRTSNNATPAPAAPAPTTPAYASPVPTEVSTTTTMAMQVLESARHERSSPKKERLLELGKIMVEGITQARNAEKAMEEAKQAARQAEVAHALCRKSLADVSRCVQEWRGNGMMNGKL